jgi:2-aminoethylphosphonate-pyruvate transaminase
VIVSVITTASKLDCGRDALHKLDEESGITARSRRPATNHRTFMDGMQRLGFVPLLAPEQHSFTIPAFYSPPSPAFQFTEFYYRLSDRGMIIYPGRLTTVNTFRIGTIGRLFETDIAQLLHAIQDVLREMDCKLPLDR